MEQVKRHEANKNKKVKRLEGQPSTDKPMGIKRQKTTGQPATEKTKGRKRKKKHKNQDADVKSFKCKSSSFMHTRRVSAI